MLYSFLNTIRANRLGGETTRGETTSGAKRLGGKRPGRKRLGGETTRGRNGLGRNDPDSDFLPKWRLCKHLQKPRSAAKVGTCWRRRSREKQEKG